MQDLDISTRDEINRLFISAQKSLSDDPVEAVRLAEMAWQMLPEPKFGWDISMTFAHDLADIYRDTGRFEDALGVMKKMFDSETVEPYQDGPRFILGTIYLEMGN